MVPIPVSKPLILSHEQEELDLPDLFASSYYWRTLKMNEEVSGQELESYLDQSLEEGIDWLKKV